MKTQYEKATEIFPEGTVTLYKGIRRFCPSDLLEHGKDDCEGVKDDLKCAKCWDKLYTGADLKGEGKE